VGIPLLGISKESGKGGKHDSCFPGFPRSVICTGSSVEFFLFPLDSASEAIGVGAGLDDMGAIGDTIKKCFAQSRIGKHGRPFRKRKVGGDENRGLLCSLGNHLKQKFSTGFFERNIAHLVNGEKLPFLPAIQGATELSVALRFYEFVDQAGGRDKTGSPSLPAGLNTKGSHQMCFAGTGRVRNIMPMDPRSSRFTISSIHYSDRVSGCSEE
jgi:hypothetical protein